MLHVAPVAEEAMWRSPFSRSELVSEGPWPDEVGEDQLMTRIIFVTNRKDSFPCFVYGNKRQQVFL